MCYNMKVSDGSVLQLLFVPEVSDDEIGGKDCRCYGRRQGDRG